MTQHIQLSTLGGNPNETQRQLEKLRNRALEIASKEREQLELEQLEQDQNLVLTLIEPASLEFEKKPYLAASGDYYRCYRAIAYLLPKGYKFTARGAIVINQVLERISQVAGYMNGPWKETAESNVEDVRQAEEQQKAAASRRATDDAEMVAIIRNELVKLLSSKQQTLVKLRRDSDEMVPLIRHYNELLKYLRSGMVRPYRGSRGIKCIHEAMRRQLTWSSRWDTWMTKDLARYEGYESKRRDEARADQRNKAAHGEQSHEQAVEDVSETISEINAEANEHSIEDEATTPVVTETAEDVGLDSVDASEEPQE